VNVRAAIRPLHDVFDFMPDAGASLRVRVRWRFEAGVALLGRGAQRSVYGWGHPA
jgi:hypothetical protein